MAEVDFYHAFFAFSLLFTWFAALLTKMFFKLKFCLCGIESFRISSLSIVFYISIESFAGTVFLILKESLVHMKYLADLFFSWGFSKWKLVY